MSTRLYQHQLFVGILFVNLASLVWATNMVMGRWLRDAIGPVSLSAARFIVASLIFAVVLRSLPPAERHIGKDRWLLVAMAMTGIVLFSPLLYWGLHYTTAINCTLINALSPLVTGILALWLLREPFSQRQMTGAVFAFFGVAFLIFGGSLASVQNAQFNRGDFIILIAVVIWGLYSVAGRISMRNRSPLSATAFSTMLGTPVLCLFAVWELQTVPVRLDLVSGLAVVYLGVVPAAIGFYLWNAGLARLGPGTATIFINTLPLYGALIGSLFLGEEISLHHMVGGVFIIGGGVFAAWQRPACSRK